MAWGRLKSANEVHVGPRFGQNGQKYIKSGYFLVCIRQKIHVLQCNAHVYGLWLVWSGKGAADRSASAWIRHRLESRELFLGAIRVVPSAVLSVVLSFQNGPMHFSLQARHFTVGTYPSVAGTSQRRINWLLGDVNKVTVFKFGPPLILESIDLEIDILNLEGGPWQVLATERLMSHWGGVVRVKWHFLSRVSTLARYWYSNFVLTVFWLFLVHCSHTVGTVLVDVWRLVHQWSFLCCFDRVLTVFDDWYTVGTLLVQS